MPTLETADVFDADSMKRLRDELLRVLARTDTLSENRWERPVEMPGTPSPSGRTIYETPLGPTITH